MWLVTGASRGLGQSLVGELLDRKIPVLAIVRNEESRRKLIDRFSNNMFLKDIIYGDLSSPKECESILQQLKIKYNASITHLVNNAGVFASKSIVDDAFIEDLDLQININLRFPILLTHLFAQSLHTGANPVIINICSSSSYDGFAGSSLYCATKHGLLGFTRSIQQDLRYRGFKTYSISPGSIDTDMSSILLQDKSTFMQASDVANKIIDIGTDSSSVYHYEVRFARHQPR